MFIYVRFPLLVNMVKVFIFLLVNPTACHLFCLLLVTNTGPVQYHPVASCSDT